MLKFPNNELGRYYWHRAWIAMWRSIGIACERSTWDTLGMWSRAGTI